MAHDAPPERLGPYNKGEQLSEPAAATLTTRGARVGTPEGDGGTALAIEGVTDTLVRP